MTYDQECTALLLNVFKAIVNLKQSALYSMEADRGHFLLMDYQTTFYLWIPTYDFSLMTFLF